MEMTGKTSMSSLWQKSLNEEDDWISELMRQVVPEYGCSNWKQISRQ